MRIGIIDLGTNSVRFDVHRIDESGKVLLLHREKLMIRLGEGVFLNYRLSSQAMKRAIHAFGSFEKTAKLLHVERMVAFGTCALREALNAETLISKIKTKTGIEIRVISGQEEAELIAIGILANEPPHKGKYGLIDIGGGSTEISICRGKKRIDSASFPLGVAQLHQVFFTSKLKSNPTPTLKRYIKQTVLPYRISAQWPKVKVLVGSSGTIRALEKIISKKEGSKPPFSKKSLSKLIDTMSGLSRSDLLKIPGMEPKRVDLIVPGAILLEECLESLGASEFIATNFSLRDGILDREIRQISKGHGPKIQFELNELYEKASRLGMNLPRIREMVAIGEDLFKATARIHKLKPEWNRYLSAACILHRVGEAITPIHFEIHSHYIVKNAEFRAMDTWEKDFLSLLCFHFHSRNISKKDLSILDKSRKKPFLYLLGLLQITAAITPDRKTSIRVSGAQLTQDSINLTLSENLKELELLRIDQKQTLFAKVFKKTIRIKSRESID